MRLNLVLLGFTALATGIVLGDGEQHPYQYETSVSWHNPYTALSSGQSPNPLTSRQALATLLTPGVAAAFASVSIVFFCVVFLRGGVYQRQTGQKISIRY